MKIDETSIKALYRRSKCRTLNVQSDIKDFKLAIKDLECALQYEEKSIIREELKKIRLKCKKYKNDLNSTFKEMFSQKPKQKATKITKTKLIKKIIKPQVKTGAKRT